MKKHDWPITEIGAMLLLGVGASQLSSCGRTSAAAAELTLPNVEVAIVEQKEIRAAEQSLVAAHADIGVAKAAYFPRLSLSGSLGGQSIGLSNRFSGPNSV
jgi:outer membrane protein TolC